MKFKVKDVDIKTGGIQVIVMNQADAHFHDLHNGDRVKVNYGNRSTVAILDLATSNKMVPPGYVALFEEVLEKLHVKHNCYVNINIEKKPVSVSYIKKKLNGGILTPAEIDTIIKDIVGKRLTDIEITYFVAACHTNLMSMKETIALTKSMIKHGDRLSFKKKYVIDKHCVGGVAGNRTTMLIVPLAAAAGLIIPKTSSRSITSPAGTADTMEVLCNVSFSIKKMKEIIKKTNGCLIWGGALDLAPADDSIIKVEHPIGIDSRSQLLASIIAKKASVGSTHVLVDIPMGHGAKINTRGQAERLKQNFISIGKQIGIKFFVMITDGSFPIGNGLGPALEARDVIHVLRNDIGAPADLRKKALTMAGRIFELVGKTKKGQGYRYAENLLSSGKAYKKFFEIIKAQGGKEVKPEEIKIGNYLHNVKSEWKGKLKHIDNHGISRVARLAGAPLDKGAGVYLHKRKNQKIWKGEILFTLYANNQSRMKHALEYYNINKKHIYQII